MEVQVLPLPRRLDDPQLQAQVELWLSTDRNPETLEFTKRLLREAPEKQIKELFLGQPLVFGTAGLRAPMGVGFCRINDLTIQQTSQGLAAYLVGRHGLETCASQGVVIGRDARHSSERFSHITAATFLSRGFKVHLFHSIVHTPLVPFALRKLKCLAGVMITASHNPKDDNGYKVYNQNGPQIIPPVDAHISKAIQENQTCWEDVEKVFDRVEGLCRVKPSKGGQLEDPAEEMLAAYLSEISEDLCTRFSETSKSDLKVVYTAMHGVGYSFAKALLERFGFSRGLIAVEPQCSPDPDFPSLSFPNPEEKNALDIALKTADANGASLVVANDPDADRLACAEKFRGTWKQFTGDEIGIILANYLLELRASKGIPKEKMLFVCSVVSSKMLKAFAEAEGAVFAETATGFKWMGNKAVEMEESRGLLPVLVYEEAIGYAVSPLVRDKDGVSSAAVLVELACKLHESGSCLSEYLESLYRRFGHFVTNNGCRPLAPEQQKKALLWLCNGGTYHKEFGPFRVRSIRDIAAQVDTGAPDGRCSLPASGGSVVTLRFENQAVLTLRPSGTEPKLKWYGELQSGDPESAKVLLQQVIDAVLTAMPL